MSDVIQLLPDSVANQIAAGEVVQRPASVVKELMENSIDADATEIRVILKNAGKSLIQVLDNGKGMSPRDVRMAFERHATSKISTAQDLFHIRTMGFRGEALAAIGSVAEVEVKTKRAEDELGTYIDISGSELRKQESTHCEDGTNIAVKNLFFNIPARRKFLKSDTTELRNITTEFLRVALAAPQLSFSLINNGSQLHIFEASGLRQRIVNAFGNNIDSKLITIQCETGIVTINGFVCSPQYAKKGYGEQFFFVNNRFMKHPFFHKAVVEAFSGLINPELIPSYFLYFTVDPAIIDVNIHPTKTEVKFQDEGAIFQIILASIKEALGRFNIFPPIDFDTENKIDFVPGEHSWIPKKPEVGYKPGYNPFDYNLSITKDDSNFEQEGSSHKDYSKRYQRDQVPPDWEKLFEQLKDKEEEKIEAIIPEMEEEQEVPRSISFIQAKRSYIITPVRSGVMFIDQKRAHELILFEHYMKTLSSERTCGQKSLFPETIDLSPEDFLMVQEIKDELAFLGFELVEFGRSCFAIYATPPDLSHAQGKVVLLSLIEHYKSTEGSLKEKMRERIALSMAKAAAIDYNTLLNRDEMNELFDSLFACKHPNFTADGKKVVIILDNDHISKWFK